MATVGMRETAACDEESAWISHLVARLTTTTTDRRDWWTDHGLHGLTQRGARVTSSRNCIIATERASFACTSAPATSAHPPPSCPEICEANRPAFRAWNYRWASRLTTTSPRFSPEDAILRPFHERRRRRRYRCQVIVTLNTTVMTFVSACNTKRRPLLELSSRLHDQRLCCISITTAAMRAKVNIHSMHQKQHVKLSSVNGSYKNHQQQLTRAYNSARRSYQSSTVLRNSLRYDVVFNAQKSNF